METRTERSEATLGAIVETALQMALADGLESLSLGEVAKRLGLSKSGVFSRIGSREALQKAVIDEYAKRFLQDVFAGMHKDFPSTYPRANPLAAYAAAFGGFAVQGSALRGGSASLVDLTGSWAGPQVLELRLPGGGVPSNALRLAVTKVK